jgi:endonuclease/exonuclease/phosphatase family metal-dependent hydrolase
MPANRFHRSGDGSVLFGLGLPVVTIALGLELLRLEFATAWAVYRERLDGSLEGLAAIELGVLGLAFLAPLVYRALGPRRALWATAGGVAVVRLAVQVVPGPSARLLLVLAGVALLLWFVPVYLRATAGTGAARGFGPVVLAGLATDTALHGGWGTLDRAWAINPATVTLTAVLAAVVFLALARLPATVGSAEAGAPETDRSGAGSRAVVAALPLGGLGAVLFLEVLLWQNLGRQAVMVGQPQHGVFLLVMSADALALVAAVAAAAGSWRVRRGSPPFSPTGWAVTGAAAAGVVLGVVMERRTPVAALLLGQVAAAVLVGRIGRWVAGRGAGLGLGPTTVAWGAGMLLFGMLVFAYYLVYERRLPYDNRWLLLVAAVAVAAAGAGAQLGLDRAAASGRSLPLPAAPARRWPVGVAWLPAVLGLALLGAPAVQRPVLAAAAPARGCPVRMLTYNVHVGYGDDTGWMDLEGLAREIEMTGAEVIGLQEVTRGWYANGSADVLAWLARRLQIPYVAFGGAADPQFGNAILSRRPVLASGVVALPRGGSPRRSSYLWADVQGCKGQVLHLMVAHLHPPSGQRGSAVRVEQVRRLLGDWGERRATVLLGDLNAGPASPEMRLLAKAGLLDGWRVAGGSRIRPPTGPSAEPEERIDYLWLSPDLRASRFGRTHGIVSDHRGVAVTVE